ncbi:MAG: hypothetical protein HDQ88_10970 [Clostridia bacterium]|nr:hypothetical protein [Clostridia bacterium]
MAENENVVVEEVPEVQPTPETPVNNGPSKGQKFKAGVKEWLRKKTVALKRKPQNIALFVLFITTIYFMLILNTISIAIYPNKSELDYIPSAGICLFVITLLSLLVLVSFLNAFPKRKKPNIFFIVLVFLMIGAIVACDIVYFVQMGNLIARPDTNVTKEMSQGQTLIIVHIVLLGLSALVFALLPVYSKLINKINTKVELESATENMHGEIDIQED